MPHDPRGALTLSGEAIADLGHGFRIAVQVGADHLGGYTKWTVQSEEGRRFPPGARSRIAPVADQVVRTFCRQVVANPLPHDLAEVLARRVAERLERALEGLSVDAGADLIEVPAEGWSHE